MVILQYNNWVSNPNPNIKIILHFESNYILLITFTAANKLYCILDGSCSFFLNHFFNFYYLKNMSFLLLKDNFAIFY
jgi:hypothetical protein